MQQYFIDDCLKLNDLYKWNDDIGHHVIRVMRMKDGDVVRVVDDLNRIFYAHINTKLKAFEIYEEVSEDRELVVRVTAVISLIKNDHFDLMIQKLTELGVYEIIPLKTERTIIKINDEQHKLLRWQKIASEAAEQSKRHMIPIIRRIIDVDQLSECVSEVNYIAYENEQSQKINLTDDIKGITFVIGPEGGFSFKEFEKIKNMGYHSVSLGKRILRAETAALFLMSLIVGYYEA